MNGTEAYDRVSHRSSSGAFIAQALDIIHDAQTTNENRQKALELLESEKQSPDAARLGYELAADKSARAVLRHHGLFLLEQSLRHKWSSFDEQQILQMRNWTISLSRDVAEGDPLYLRNKVAQLFLELAKKDWALSWYDMDSILLALWKHSPIHQELVLTVLENLSEDVFVRDDAASSLRGSDLNHALVEIFTSTSTFPDGHNKGRPDLRADSDGWLVRISHLLTVYASSGVDAAQTVTCTCKALATLRSAFTWIMGSAIVTAQCLTSICACLNLENVNVLLASIEALHSLYSRTGWEATEFVALIDPIHSPDSVARFDRLYNWSIVDCHDIDPSRYIFSKKLAETIAFVLGHIGERQPSELAVMNLSPFFQLTIRIIQHSSLVVSIPVLHTWAKLLRSDQTVDLAATGSVIGPLLNITSQRIIRYELFPEDSDEPSVIFLNDDIDTVPERHAFLGNYRRFCYQIIESVAQRRPREAVSHILSEVDSFLDRIESETPSLDPSTYKKTSTPLLRLDAQLTVVEAALKGYGKWVLDDTKQSDHHHQQEREFLEANIYSWANGLLKRNYEDPLMKQRVIKLVVECSARALPRNQAFALQVLEHILLTKTTDQPQYPAFSEAVRELQVYATGELRRLALRHADYFASFYQQLESKIQAVVSSSSLDEKAEADMYGTLLIVMQHAAKIDLTIRVERLEHLTRSALDGWQSQQLDAALADFDQFCRYFGIDQVSPYLGSKQANNLADWSQIQLDNTGLSIQSFMNDFLASVPLRMTKVAFGVTTEKLEENSEPYQIAVSIWTPRIPLFLPKILRLVQYAHRLHDIASWPNLLEETRPSIGRLLRDRFWQAGISSGSRDEFYSRVTSTKSTLEGFASFVRGRLRLIREACYQILHSMSRLGHSFYSYPELPKPLAESLIANTVNLSAHQFSILLQMMRSVVDGCPPEHRTHFLPPILSMLFQQMDQKITSEWQELGQRKTHDAGEDSLVLEMKEESILRQLTYTAATFVAVLLDPARDHNQQLENQEAETDDLQHDRSISSSALKRRLPSLRVFILTNPDIFEPLLRFSTSLLTVPDSRSTSIITKVLRTVIPFFAGPSKPSAPEISSAPLIREYISSSVLKAAITSLHDGYYADLQKELASLIATIWLAYGCSTHIPATVIYVNDNSHTNHAGGEAKSDDINGSSSKHVIPAHTRPPLTLTPRNVLLSLPSMTTERVDAVANNLAATGGVISGSGNARQQRALVLDLLDGLRGVRLSELGKMSVPRFGTNSSRIAGTAAASSEKDAAIRRWYDDHGHGMDSRGMGETNIRTRGGGADQGRETDDDGPDLGVVGSLLG